MPIKVSVEQTGLERSIQNAAKQAGRNLKINLGTSARDVKSLEQPLGRITGQADEFGKSMEAANARVLAFGASVGIINAVVQSFKSLVSTTIEVEANLAKINSILQTTNSGLNALKNQIFDIARNTEQTFDTVADAALELSRQGLSATEVTKRLNDSLILSRLSGISAAEAVSGLTAAVNSFTKAGLTTGEVLNKISNAANQFAVSERDLIEGFKRSASVAELAGVSIDELGGIITAVQQKTARGGAVIGNSFKTIFTRIGRSENLELLNSLGVQITDIQGKILPATKLIENLAQQLDKLGDVEVREVTQKIGGGFQIAPLLAALSDYSSEASVAIQATEAFRNATDQAYKKNEALNKTLSAAINQTTLSVKELANALGELGVTDTFRTVLEFFNNLVQNAKSILDGEGLGGDFARGIVKGLGSVLVKGGLALFGALILKLSLQLGKFGINSLKTFLGLNKAAEQQKNIQQQIVGVLLSDESIRKQILNIENSSLSQEQKRLQQAQFFNTLLNERAAITSKLSGIAGGTAAILGGSTGKTSRSADGFLPIGAEQKDISKGVGGAPSGAKPVVIPNFSFGGGQKGTMVANSSEYIVPNFAGGGSAIFNQDMVKSMGLPEGAKKINAAGGFVPNFAYTLGTNKDSIAIRSVTSPIDQKIGGRKRGTGAVKGAIKAAVTKANERGFTKITADIISDSSLGAFTKYFGRAKRGKNVWDKSEFRKNAAGGFIPNFVRPSIPLKQRDDITTRDDAIAAGYSQSAASSRFGKASTRQSTFNTYNANKDPKKAIMLVPNPVSILKGGLNKKYTKDKFIETPSGKSKISQFLGGFAGIDPGLNEKNSGFGRLLELDEIIERSLAKAANDTLNNFDKLVPSLQTDPANYSSKQVKNLFLKEGGAGALTAYKGAIFEGLINAISGGVETDNDSSLDVDFRGKSGKILEEIFGLEGKEFKFGDFKASDSSGNKEKYRNQILKNLPKELERKSIKRADKRPGNKAAAGYIPNYAQGGALEEAIQREKEAGVPVNQIRINQDGKLRNSQNPAGLAVTNTRDEPTGRIPNFSNLTGGVSREQLFPNSDFSSSGGSPKIDKGAEVSAGKLFALSSAAFALQSIFAGVGNETEGFTKNLSEAASGLIGLVTTVTLLQSIGQDPLKGGLIGGVGKLGKGAGGKFSAILNSIGKVGPGIVKTFSFLGKWGLKAVPILGQLLLGFQALSSIGSLFGKDLVGPIKDFGAKILSSVGFIATPAEKAAEGLKKLNEELFKERFGKGPVNVAELSIKRLELPRTKEGKVETDPLAVLASRIKDTATGTQSRAFFKKDVAVSSTPTSSYNPTIAGSFATSRSTKTETQFFAPDINGKIKEINEETYNLFEATAEAAVIESTNAILNTLSQAKQQELLKDPKKLEQTIKEQRAKLEKEFGKEGLNSFDAANRQITQEEALLKTREGIAAKEGKDATPLLLANIEKSKETLTVLNKIRSLYLGYLIGDTKELTKQQKLEITRKTLVADVVKIQDKARFQNAITLAGLKTELEYRLEIQSSLQSTSQFQKEANKRQLDSLVFTKKRNIELAKSARAALEGNPAIQRSFKVEAGKKITPEQLKVYQQTVESISRAALEGEAITLGFIQEQLDLNGDILGNKEDVSAVIFATVEAQKSQLRIEEAQVNLARERATIQKIILDQEKRKLDLEASSFGKQSKRIQEAKELFNLEKDLQIKKIEGRAIGGSQGAQFNAKQEINKIEQQKIDKGLELDTKALTNSFRKSIFDAVSSAGFKNLLTGDNLEAIKQAEGSVGFDALINDLEKQAEVEEKRRINAASDEALKQLEILTQQKLIQNDFRSSVELFSLAAKLNSDRISGELLVEKGKLSPDKFIKILEQGISRIDEQPSINDGRRTAIITGANKGAEGIESDRAKGLKGAEGFIRFDVDFLSYVADFNKLVKGAELASQALINSLAESGASLTTFANLVRAEFNKISETRAQNAFTLATSADPSAIQGALSSDIRLNTLQGGLESGLSGAESIQKANELVALQQKQLDIVSARTGAEKISAQFELEKLRETLALRQEIAAIDPNDPKKSEKIFEIQKKIASIQTKSQSFSQKFQSEFYKTERQNVEELQDTIISGARRFSDTLASGLNDALVKGEDLGDVLTSAAFDFFNELSKKSIGQLLDKSISGIAGLFGFDPEDIDLEKNDGSSPDSALFVKNVSEAEKKVLKNSDDLKSILGEKTKRGYTSSAPLFVSIVSGSIGDLIGSSDISQQKEKQKIPDSLDRATQFKPVGTVGKISVEDKEKQSQNFISKYFSNIAEKFGDVFSKFLSGFKSLLGFGGNASGNNTAEDGFGSTIGGALGSIFGPVGSQVGSFIGGLLPFNQGGYVEGGSGSKDDVPAMLMGGEYVMKKKSVNKYGSGFMEKLNNGKIKKFADGGLVGEATKEDSEEEPENSFLSDYITKQNSISRFGKEFVDSISGSKLQEFASGGMVEKRTESGSIASKWTPRSDDDNIKLKDKQPTGVRSESGLPSSLWTPEVSIKNPELRLKKDFLDSVSGSSIQKFAGGGLVQSGKGGFFAPGLAGAGTIKGKKDLLEFATQGATSGETDFVKSGSSYGGGFSAIALEPESVSLTNLGRSLNTPLQEATKNAKQQAFGVLGQQLELEAQVKEAQKQAKEQRDQLIKSALINIALQVASSAATGGLNGAKNVSGVESAAGSGVNASGQTLTNINAETGIGFVQNPNLGQRIGSGFKGSIFGSKLPGGGDLSYGGLRNIFNGRANITPETLEGYINSKSPEVKNLTTLNYLSGSNKNIPFASDRPRPQLLQDSLYGTPRRATGGPIPETTGVDTVPAMLSGGEFVMNSGAADRIGKGNLERMNSGLDSNSSESDEKLISKLDELIVVTKDSTGEINITINEGGSEGQGQEQEETSGGSSQSKNRTARKIKEEVLKIIKEEKRLGGSLRNDKL